jgi:hypothetical protein
MPSQVPARLFLLYVGHAEEGSNAGAVLYHPGGFETVEDGLLSLARIFRFTTESEFEEAKERARAHHRCPHCGKLPIIEDPIGPDDVCERVRDFVGGVTDGQGHLFDTIDRMGWEYINSVPRELWGEVVVVREDADKMLGDLAFRCRPQEGPVGRPPRDDESWIYYFDWEADRIDVPPGLPFSKEATP